MGHLDVNAVAFALPDGRPLLREVTFRVGEGAKVALIGPNGTGKTTLLRILAGDLTASEGAVTRSGGLGVMRQFIGKVRDEVAVYGSGGFTTYDPNQLHDQLTGWTQDEQIPRVKIKIGESWGTNTSRDLNRMEQARACIGDEVELLALHGLDRVVATPVGHDGRGHAATLIDAVDGRVLDAALPDEFLRGGAVFPVAELLSHVDTGGLMRHSVNGEKAS